MILRDKIRKDVLLSRRAVTIHLELCRIYGQIEGYKVNMFLERKPRAKTEKEGYQQTEETI